MPDGRPWYTQEDYARDFHPRGRETPSVTPGAWLAKQRGCTCSRIDNNNGWGSVYAAEGEHEFLVTPDCPLHDTRNPSETPELPDK